MEILKDMFASKKHIVAFIAMLVVALNRKLGLGLQPEEVNQIVTTACILIIGQGAADFGKNRVATTTPRVSQETPKP